MVYLRPKRRNYLPPPYYDSTGDNVTIAFHFGGHLHYIPVPNYVGGEVVKYDFVELTKIDTMNKLQAFADEIEFPKPRQFYHKQCDTWCLINGAKQLKDWYNTCLMHKEVRFYVVSDIFEENAQATEPQSHMCIREEVEDESDDIDYAPDSYNGSSEDDKLYEANVVSSENNVVSSEKEVIVFHETENNEFDHNSSDGSKSGDDESSESDVNVVVDSDEDIDSELDSDLEEEGRPKNRPKKIFSRPNNLTDPKLEEGMRFENKAAFRKVVFSHAIKGMRPVKIGKNAKKRIYAKCDVKDCKWHVHAKIVDVDQSWVIYKYQPDHTCGQTYNVHNCKSTWLAERYLGKFKSDPERSVASFIGDVKEELRIDISEDQAYRAKRKAIDILQGDPNAQYAKLWDYGEELKRTNPGTTVIVLIDEVTGKFSHFYVCFQALKQAFLIGCRPLIGVDGCHLKGPHDGVLLTACTVDPNNKPLPLAWVVVSTESGATWSWFLRCLQNDLQLNKLENYTFMSDKQKGLINAFDEVLPGSNHRFCIRHLWKNMFVAGFKSDAHRNALFKASNATTIGSYRTAMKEIEQLDKKCFQWLQDKHPSGWSKAYFNTLPKCDMTLNNGCENFNKCILKAREKPVLTMLEWLREYAMTKHQKNRDKARKRWNGLLCPEIQKTLQKNILLFKDCIAKKADDTHFQITCSNGEQYNVDLGRKSCSCRRWDLTGIPCKHAVSAFSQNREDPVKHVHKCYHIATYNAVYQGTIYGINGTELWGETHFVPPLPPKFGRRKGRPEKARRLGLNEVQKKKKKGKGGSKKGQKTITCSYCGGQGHNMATCFVKEQHLQEEAELIETEIADEENARIEAEILMSHFERQGRNEDLGHSEVALLSKQVQISNEMRKRPARETRASRAKKQHVEVDQVLTTSSITRDVNVIFEAQDVPIHELQVASVTATPILRPCPSFEQQLQSSASPVPNFMMNSRVKIRAPPPMAGNQFLNSVPVISSQTSSSVTPFTVGGKKYVTMSKLVPAMQEMQKKLVKGKGKKKA